MAACFVTVTGVQSPPKLLFPFEISRDSRMDSKITGGEHGDTQWYTEYECVNPLA